MKVDQPSIQTSRLLLRPFTLDDANNISQIARSPQVLDTSMWLPEHTEAEWIGSHAENYNAGATVHFAIQHRGELCGYVGASLSLADRYADMGFFIDSQFWNRGFATESCTAFIEFSIHKLELHRIASAHFSRNLASGRVMQKLGMTYEGTLRQRVYKDGVYEDLELYGLLDSEWPATT